MTSENGSGARPKDRSLSSGRSLRNLPTKDYKKFSEGDFCFSEDEKDTINSGSDADSKKVPPGTLEAECACFVCVNAANVENVIKNVSDDSRGH